MGIANSAFSPMHSKIRLDFSSLQKTFWLQTPIAESNMQPLERQSMPQCSWFFHCMLSVGYNHAILYFILYFGIATDGSRPNSLIDLPCSHSLRD